MMTWEGMRAMPNCPQCLQCQPICIIVWDTFDQTALIQFIVNGNPEIANSELTLSAGMSIRTATPHPEGEFASSKNSTIAFVEDGGSCVVKVAEKENGDCLAVVLTRNVCTTAKLVKVVDGVPVDLTAEYPVPEQLNGVYPISLCWKQGPEGEEGEPGGETFTVEAYADTTDNSNPPWTDPNSALGFPDDLGSTAGIPAGPVDGSWGFNTFDIPATAIINWIRVGFRCFQFGDTFEPAFLESVSLSGFTGESVLRNLGIELSIDVYGDIGDGGPGDNWGGGFVGEDFVSFGVAASFTSTIGTSVNLDSVFLEVNYTTAAGSGQPRLGLLSCNIGTGNWPNGIYLEARDVEHSGLYAGLEVVSGTVRFSDFLWTYLPGIDEEGKIRLFDTPDHSGCPDCFPVCNVFEDEHPEADACNWEVIDSTGLILRHVPQTIDEDGIRFDVTASPTSLSPGPALFVDWVDVSNNRQIRLQSDGTNATIAIYRFKADVLTLLSTSNSFSWNGLTPIRITVCWRDDVVYASAGGVGVGSSDSESIGGTKIGLDLVTDWSHFTGNLLDIKCGGCSPPGNQCSACITGTTNQFFIASLQNFLAHPDTGFADLSHSQILGFGVGYGFAVVQEADGTILGSDNLRPKSGGLACVWAAQAAFINNVGTVPRIAHIYLNEDAFLLGIAVSVIEDENGGYWLHLTFCIGAPQPGEPDDHPCGTYGRAVWGIFIGNQKPDCTKLNYENLPLLYQSFFHVGNDPTQPFWWDAPGAIANVKAV